MFTSLVVSQLINNAVVCLSSLPLHRYSSSSSSSSSGLNILFSVQRRCVMHLFGLSVQRQPHVGPRVRSTRPDPQSVISSAKQPKSYRPTRSLIPHHFGHQYVEKAEESGGMVEGATILDAKCRCVEFNRYSRLRASLVSYFDNNINKL